MSCLSAPLTNAVSAYLCICVFVFVYLKVRHPGTLFLRSQNQYLFKNIATGETSQDITSLTNITFKTRHMGREDVFRRKKYTIPKLNAFLSILVPRVTSQNFKMGPLWDFEKRPFQVFFAYLGPFFHFWAIFGPFFGVGQIFLVSRHHGGHHRSILIFGLFHFLAIFGHFLAVFAFLGHFCIFKWFQENQ